MWDSSRKNDKWLPDVSFPPVHNPRSFPLLRIRKLGKDCQFGTERGYEKEILTRE